jgi:hypothetical protein
MSHFYGTLQGNRGEATRCGTVKTGMVTHCASWDGAVRCEAYVNGKGVDCVIVQRVPWKGRGTSELLYDGPIG